MPEATMTSKGQITVPKSIRKRLHLNAGDKVEFQYNSKGEVILIPENKSVTNIFGMLSYKAKRTISVIEMDKLVEDAFKRANQ